MRRSRATFAFLTVAAILVGFGQPHAAKAEALSGPGAIESVTVYRGQAMVTRTLSLAELEGRAEVVFTELPVHVVSDSVAAEAGPGVEVGFTRYRTRPVAEDVREEVRELDQQIEAVQHELQNVEAKLQLITHARQYLTNLEGFTANTAKTELANGVLNAETLTSLSDYLLKKRADLAERELVAQRERQELGERQNLLQRERHRLTSASSRTAREAVISLNVVEPGPDAAVRLRYLVTHATWSPSYAVRAGGDGGPVRIEYHASIEQTSGEDWNDVAMTLSTATPTLTAEAPELASLVLQLTRGADASQLAKNFGYDNLEEAQREIRGQQQQVAKQRDIQGGKASPAQANGALFGDRDPMPRETNDQRLNTLAANAQALEMLAERPTDADRLAATTRSLSRPTDDSLSVAYALDGRTSLPSRSDRQLARIRSLELPAETYLTAVPVLTNKVYREASLTNTSGLVLLSGPVASYLDGRFVGHSQMPSVFEGERFEVGLGVDATLRASREVLDRQEKVQGGNRLLTLTYALRLMNFSDEPADVRLMGRLPVSDNDQAVKITLADSGQPLSDAAGYTQALRDDGILRWDVNVPAHATGDEAFELTYRVTIEHDKQLTFGDVSTR
ncbi:MAG: mucoidy inhibitor MuiA family protein [Phycisphaeraceae bacterium]